VCATTRAFFIFRGPRCFKVPSSPPFRLGLAAGVPAIPTTGLPLPCAQSARGDRGSERSGPVRSPAERPCGRRQRSCTGAPRIGPCSRSIRRRAIATDGATPGAATSRVVMGGPSLGWTQHASKATLTLGLLLHRNPTQCPQSCRSRRWTSSRLSPSRSGRVALSSLLCGRGGGSSSWSPKPCTRRRSSCQDAARPMSWSSGSGQMPGSIQ
jgi:hypothetical protein